MHAYEGGVDGVPPCEVAGLPSWNEAWAARLALDARSVKPGDSCRGEWLLVQERKSFMRLSLSRPSNLRRRSCAHSSPYWPSEDEGLGLKGVPRPSMVKQLKPEVVVGQVVEMGDGPVRCSRSKKDDGGSEG